MRLSCLPGMIWLISNRTIKCILRFIIRPLFAKCGKNVSFYPFDSFSYRTITIGDDVYIGPGAKFAASKVFITIGNKVLFGPNVTIMAGDHNTGVIGQFLIDVKEKRPEDDQPVSIEDDVWIGSGAIILKGVRLARGTIVAAGSVVTCDTLPYSVVAGVPARVLRVRWPIDKILEHERALYPESNRISRQVLESSYGTIN